jgi:HK97 gp10 family phage protein
MLAKVINLDSCIRKFGNIDGIDVMPEITESTRKVQKTARELAPKDTGYLYRSIHRKLYPRQRSGVVYTTTEYASYQEFGTSKMKAQPYMIPAVNIHRAGIVQSMRSYLRQQARRKTK